MQQERSAKPGNLTFAIVVVLLLGGFLGFASAQRYMKAFLVKKPVSLRQSFRDLPREIGKWKRVGSDQILSAEIIESLGTDLYLTRDYAVDGDVNNGLLKLHISYYTGMVDAVPHIPEVCLVGNGLTKSPGFTALAIPLDTSSWWNDPESDKVIANHGNAADTEPYKMTRTHSGEFVRMPRGSYDELKMNISQYWDQANPDYRIAAGYFFIANGGTTPFSSKVRLMAFRLTDEYAYYCKVQLTYIIPGASVTPENLAEVAGDLLSNLLPDIMLCLPDWYEIEHGIDDGKI